MLARACLSVVAILVDVLPPRVPGTGCLVPPAVSILLCRRSSAFYVTVLFHDFFRVSVIFFVQRARKLGMLLERHDEWPDGREQRSERAIVKMVVDSGPAQVRACWT